jgi:hypothetical protein
MTFCGQASTQSTQPLQRAVSMTIAPFIFAIDYICLLVLLYLMGAKLRKVEQNAKGKLAFLF